MTYMMAQMRKFLSNGFQHSSLFLASFKTALPQKLAQNLSFSKLILDRLSGSVKAEIRCGQSKRGAWKSGSPDRH